MAPGTEFARDFCAGIGPLQLGVVLVYLLFYDMNILDYKTLGTSTLRLPSCGYHVVFFGFRLICLLL